MRWQPGRGSVKRVWSPLATRRAASFYQAIGYEESATYFPQAAGLKASETRQAEIPSPALHATCFVMLGRIALWLARTKRKKADLDRPKSISNRRAHFEYSIGETFEAGLVLTGTEIKSVRMGQVNLADAFCQILQGELFVRQMHISPYEQGNRYNVDAVRPRKLLLHNWQIIRLQAAIQEKGLTIVPTRLYFVRGRAKIEIGVGKGRKLYDKRDRIADRDQERQARRELAER